MNTDIHAKLGEAYALLESVRYILTNVALTSERIRKSLEPDTKLIDGLDSVERAAMLLRESPVTTALACVLLEAHDTSATRLFVLYLREWTWYIEGNLDKLSKSVKKGRYVTGRLVAQQIEHDARVVADKADRVGCELRDLVYASAA